SALTSITIPDSVTSIGFSAFNGCTGLTSMTLPFVGATISGNANTHFGHLFGAKDYQENSSSVPSTLTTVVVMGGNISESAFRSCSKLTSVTLLDSVTSIGGYAFNYCESLTNITIGNSVRVLANMHSSGAVALQASRSVTV
ncbi:MAG: leucine-rich repeat domain-containing protein, partial [Clostridia bacterium]|nr:leucine-rich repeat domain-containing protein [Clostridia bacterium]